MRQGLPVTQEYHALALLPLLSPGTDRFFADDVAFDTGDIPPSPPPGGLLLEISGIIVRLTTCQRLTNSLPKLSLIT